MLDEKLLTELTTYVEGHLGKVDLHMNEDLQHIAYHTSPSVIPDDLANYIDNHRKLTFQQMLFHFIDERSMSDVTIYKKAWIDRKHFSKIRSDPNYQIGKNSAIALALALELSQIETEELLHTAGFSLSDSNTSDLVIQFCLENKLYNLHAVNEALDYFDLKPLGNIK